MGKKRTTKASSAKAKTKPDTKAETSSTEDEELEATLKALEAEDEAQAETKVEAEADDNTAVDDASGDEVDLPPESVDAVLKSLEEGDKKASESKAKSKGGSKTVTKAPVQRDFYSVAAIDQSALDKARNDMAKKVGEKAANVIDAIERGRKLSRYTGDAVTILSKEGRVSAKTLCEAFLNAGLKEGTARAQSQQMTALFKGMGIAKPDDNNNKELVVADANLVKELAQLAA